MITANHRKISRMPGMRIFIALRTGVGNHSHNDGCQGERKLQLRPWKHAVINIGYIVTIHTIHIVM